MQYLMAGQTAQLKRRDSCLDEFYRWAIRAGQYCPCLCKRAVELAFSLDTVNGLAAVLRSYARLSVALGI